MPETLDAKTVQLAKRFPAGLFPILLLLASLAGGASRAWALQPTTQIAAVSEAAPEEPEGDPPVKLVGERLFKETRFAQYFAVHMRDNDVNLPPERDPFMEVVRVPRAPGGTVPNPYRGKSMNCRACHFVEELSMTVTPVGSRSYADFDVRSRVPVREDGQVSTARNSANMVSSLVAPPGLRFLHRDGEFVHATTLIVDTLTGRNLGWLPRERNEAIAHIARVIREDDGKSLLARAYDGVSYAKSFLGEAPDIPKEYLLPPEYRIDVNKASDQQVVNAVARIIAGYMETLTFSTDSQGRYNGSPYDLFLAKNELPRKPEPGESDLQYSQRLLKQVELLEHPKWVSPKDGAFKYFMHQPFVFNRSELEGLKVFLRLSPETRAAAKAHHRSTTLLAVTLLPSIGLVWFGLTPAGRRHPLLVIVPLLASAVFLFASAAVRPALAQPAAASGEAALRSTHAGNCAACHTPPHFTDFKFHNTGATQDSYDTVHGAGAFARLSIPSYAERQRAPEAYLPVTTLHPNASGIFRSPANASDPRLADLGMWNVYANDDFPEPQQPMQALMCASVAPCTPDEVLPRTIARFKTPTVRDLGQSDPYLHSGEKKAIEDVLIFYQKMSALAREGKLRNGDPAIAGVTLDDLEVVYVAAFLRSLNEDYE